MTFKPYTVQLQAEDGITTFTARDGSQKDVPTVTNGMVGVVIEHLPDDDVLVLFDHRVEAVNSIHLVEYHDPTRQQMWEDCLFLEVGDQFEAVQSYWVHINTLLRRAAMAVKTCSVCKEEKPLREFSFDAGRRDGYSSKCKECDLARKAPMNQQ